MPQGDLPEHTSREAEPLQNVLPHCSHARGTRDVDSTPQLKRVSMTDNVRKLDRRQLLTKARPERDDAETVAMRTRLQYLQTELDRLKQAIEEHFARLNADTGNRDASKH